MERALNSQYMSTSTHTCRVSDDSWDWISKKGAGMLHHIEGHLGGVQYEDVFQNVMLPTVQSPSE
jgi:hypothetical protein